MNHDREIRTLKNEINDIRAALVETRFGVAGLVTCIAQTLAESDPKMGERSTKNFQEWYRHLGSRPRTEAKEIGVLFGRAVVDPAFPFSSKLSIIGDH